METFWQSKDRELPNNLVCNEGAFPNIYRLLVVARTLPITSAEAEQFFFTDEMNQDLLYVNNGAIL